MTVSAETVPPSSSSTATVTDVNGHKNIHFQIAKGDNGKPFIIKGEAYDTLEDLEEAITHPEEGDMYNVGTTPPYNMYRWTGLNWEDQGTIGISVLDLNNSDIDSIWNGTAISGTDRKYLNDQGLLYLVVNKVLTALNGKVDASSTKGLSTNDFTDAYKNLVDSNASGITTLSSTKVDKVEGKTLSTNDYTTAEKTKLAGIATGATRVILDDAIDGTSSNGVKNSVIANAFTATDARIDKALGNFAALYSASATYNIDDVCIQNGDMYKCTTQIVYAEPWTSGHWQKIDMSGYFNIKMASAYFSRVKSI